MSIITPNVVGFFFSGFFSIVSYHLWKKYLFNDNNLNNERLHYSYNEIINNNDLNNNSYCFTPLDDVVIEYIKELNIKNILEMCAGDGSNAKIMRENGLNVLAYDLKTDKENSIQYGICGTLEHLYSDYLLFIASGICSEKSIENYSGNYVLLGGHGNNIVILEDKIEVVIDISCSKIDYIDNISTFDSPNKNRGVRLDMRPDSKFMKKNNFFLKKMWFVTDKNPKKWQNLYVFQLWEKNI